MSKNKSIVFKIDDLLHKEFKLACIKNDASMQGEIERFIRWYVEKNK